MTELEKKKQELAELEWEDFTRVKNEGGRASCQDNRKMFFLMRLSQFTAWPETLVDSYTEDLKRARTEGRNLPAEKYAWMMEDTAPEEFRRIAHLLPERDPEKDAMIREIAEQETCWFREYAREYPRIAAGNRKAETNSGSLGGTSMSVYLKGELQSYSTRTVRLYLDMVRSLKQEGRNLALLVMEAQMKGYGFKDLADAEARIDR